MSADRHATYIAVQLTAADDSQRRGAFETIKQDLTAPGLTAQVGGDVAVQAAGDDVTKRDVARAEMFSMPVLLVLLVIIFRQRGRRVDAARRRWPCDRRRVRRRTADHRGHHGVHVRDQHHHADRPRPLDRLLAIRGQPVPRGDGRRATVHTDAVIGDDGDRRPYRRGLRVDRDARRSPAC